MTWTALRDWLWIRRIELSQREIDLLVDLEMVQPKEFNPDG